MLSRWQTVSKIWTRLYSHKFVLAQQDADRLDAIGAVGLARCFTFGGTHQRALYTRAQDDGSVRVDGNKDDTSSFGHLFEKLLLIKDKMNTDAGRRAAAPRHAFLEAFVTQLLAETHEEYT